MLRIAAYLFGLILLCCVALAAFTVPARWQVHQIAPELPDWEALDSALAEGDGPVSIEYINTASQATFLGELSHPAILIGWADGRRFLIDTGMPPDQAQAFGKPMELFGAEPTRTYGGVATQLGDTAETVKGVAFTHLHNDHTEGLPGLCAAQAVPASVFQTPLQQRELNYTTDIGMVSLDGAACPREVLETGLIKRVPDFEGLLAVAIGGHTPGSTLYAVRVQGKTWVFSGDITNDRRSLTNDLPKPWWYSTLIVPEDVARTALLRNWLRQLDGKKDVTVLPAHDVGAMAGAGLTRFQK